MTFPHIDSSSVYIGLCSSVVCSLFSILHISWVPRTGVSPSLTPSLDLKGPALPRAASPFMWQQTGYRLLKSPVWICIWHQKQWDTHCLNKTRQRGFRYLLKTNSWFNVSIVKKEAMINIAHLVFWSFREWFGSKELNVIESHMEQTNPSVHTYLSIYGFLSFPHFLRMFATICQFFAW